MTLFLRKTKMKKDLNLDNLIRENPRLLQGSSRYFFIHQRPTDLLNFDSRRKLSKTHESDAPFTFVVFVILTTTATTSSSLLLLLCDKKITNALRRYSDKEAASVYIENLFPLFILTKCIYLRILRSLINDMEKS